VKDRRRSVGLYLLPAVVLAVLAVPVPLLADRPAPARADRRAGPLPTVGLAPGQRAVWLGHASSRLLILVTVPVAAVLAAAALLVGPPEGWIFLFAAAVVGVAAALTATIDVTVAPTGVRVGFGPFGVPRKVIPLDRIERADAIDVNRSPGAAGVTAFPDQARARSSCGAGRASCSSWPAIAGSW
jgi:hypothetical protein